MQRADKFGLGALGLALSQPRSRETSRTEAGREEVNEVPVLAELFDVATLGCNKRNLQPEDTAGAWKPVLQDEGARR